MTKVLSLQQLLQKKFEWLEELPTEITDTFGTLTKNFVLIVWGQSGNGKSNFIMQLLSVLMNYGKVLYVSLEEGTGASMQLMALRQLNETANGKIRFADSRMRLAALRERLEKRRSEQFIVIDSIQYFNMDYLEYQALKEDFPNKSFFFISHANGKWPEGKTANRVRYDADVKIRIDGFIAFARSRFKMHGDHKNYVIYEKFAKRQWGKKYKEALTRLL